MRVMLSDLCRPSSVSSWCSYLLPICKNLKKNLNCLVIIVCGGSILMMLLLLGNHVCELLRGVTNSSYCSFSLILMVSQIFCALWKLDVFKGAMLYLICNSSVFNCSCSLQCMNLSALFKTLCIFLFLS